MTKSITEQLVDVILEIHKTVPQIESSTLISIAGFTLAYFPPSGIDDDTQFREQADLFFNAQNLISQYPIGSFEFVCVQGGNGVNLLIPVNEQCFLSVLAQKDVDDVVKGVKHFVPKIDALVANTKSNF